MLTKKLTFQTNKYALREKTQNLSVKTGKNGVDTCFRNIFFFQSVGVQLMKKKMIDKISSSHVQKTI
jgi:hypothetical protein